MKRVTFKSRLRWTEDVVGMWEESIRLSTDVSLIWKEASG